MARIISIKNSAYTWNQVVRLFNEECSNMYFGKEKLLPSEQEDERIISSFLLSFLKDESLLAQQKMTMGFSIEPICSDTAIYLIRLVPYMKEGHPDLIEGYNDCFAEEDNVLPLPLLQVERGPEQRLNMSIADPVTELELGNVSIYDTMERCLNEVLLPKTRRIHSKAERLLNTIQKYGDIIDLQAFLKDSMTLTDMLTTVTPVNVFDTALLDEVLSWRSAKEAKLLLPDFAPNTQYNLAPNLISETDIQTLKDLETMLGTVLSYVKEWTPILGEPFVQMLRVTVSIIKEHLHEANPMTSDIIDLGIKDIRFSLYTYSTTNRAQPQEQVLANFMAILQDSGIDSGRYPAAPTQVIRHTGKSQILKLLRQMAANQGARQDTISQFVLCVRTGEQISSTPFLLGKFIDFEAIAPLRSM